MLNLILLAIYALFCAVQLALILRSEPGKAEQPDQSGLALMASWWYGFPI